MMLLIPIWQTAESQHIGSPNNTMTPLRMKQKSELTSTYKDCEKEVRELKRKQENLNQYLGRTQPDPAQEQQEKKDTPNL